jgi:hypothetical protein
MKQSDIEDALAHIKFPHLTQSELVSYCDQELNRISLARAEAHLKLCLICDRRLTYLQEERAALDNREITADSVALVRRVMQKMESQQQPSSTEVTLPDRLAEHLQQMVESWQAHFKSLIAVRGGVDTGKEAWKWKSKDGVLKARAMLEKNADLIINLYTNDLSLEGVRLKFRIGLMNRKITLRRISGSEIYAQIRVPEHQCPKNLADISIEIV